MGAEQNPHMAQHHVHIHTRAEIAWPWRSMWTSSMSRGMPPSSPSDPEAMLSELQQTSGNKRITAAKSKLNISKEWLGVDCLIGHVRNASKAHTHTLILPQTHSYKHTHANSPPKSSTVSKIQLLLKWAYKNRWPALQHTWSAAEYYNIWEWRLFAQLFSSSADTLVNAFRRAVAFRRS